MSENKTEKKLLVKATATVFVGRLVESGFTKNGNYLFTVVDEDGVAHRVVVPLDMVVDDLWENDIIRCGWEREGKNQRPIQVTVIESA